LSIILKTKYVYERQKCNLRLQNSGYGLFPGLISLLPDFQNLSMEVTLMMFDQVLLTGIFLNVIGWYLILYIKGWQPVAREPLTACEAILCGPRLEFIISIKIWNFTLCIYVS